MMNSNNGIQLYLNSVRKEVSKAINDEAKDAERFIHVVLGNESGDLDSVVSAVIYAYFLQKQIATDSKNIFIPVLNFGKDDIILKTEVNAIFEKFGVNTEILVFKDALSNIIPVLKEVTLVDHNELSAELMFLRDFVTNIIDHHDESGSFEDPYITKTIESVGSCSTLIAEKVYNKSESLFAEFPIADLLLSTILLDTVNLKLGIGRTTEKDIEFAEELEQYASCPMQELFDVAQKVKYSTLHLAVKDILRKDLKTLFGNKDLCIGISSVTASAKDFLSKDGAHERTLAFAKHNSMHAVIIMFIHTEDSKAIRELAVCSFDDKLLQSILTNLLEKDDLQLQLQRELENMKIFSQGNSMVSRKVLSPYIMNFLSDVVTSKQQSTDSHLYGKPNENTNHLLMENGTEAHVYSSNESARDSEGGIRPSNDVTMVIPELTVSNQINSKHTELGEYELDSLHLNGNGEVSNQMDRSFEDSPSGLIDSNEEKLLFHESVASSCSIRTQNASNGFSESFTGDMSIEQPSLEYDETWKLHMYDVKSPDISSDEQSRKHKIVIKDLSFDDNSSISELTRIDLLCPVFLAVTEDEEDDDYVLKDIRRKTKSIENLFSTIDEEQEFPLRRTKSELPSKYKTQKRKRMRKHDRLLSSSERNRFDRNDSIKEEQVDMDENPFVGDRELGSDDDDDDGNGDDGDNGGVNDDYDYDDAINDDDDDDNCSLNTSSSHHSNMAQEFLERRNSSYVKNDVIGSGKSQHLNGSSRAVVSFSFSEDECNSYETEKLPKKSISSECSCSQYDLNNMTCCPHHVKGLWDRFITVSVGGLLRVVDLKLIDPFVKVISHGGFHETADGRRVVMVFTSEFLPKKYIPKYNIIMEQLFYYAVHTIDLSVQDTYEIVYFNGRGSNKPGSDWLKKCYDMVERRLKKNLSTLYIVHPDFWLKTMIHLYKPFMSSKFSRNIEFIKSLRELKRHLSLEYIFIPDEVKRNDPDADYWFFR